MRSIEIATTDKKYEVLVGRGLDTGKLVSAVKSNCRVMLVTDDIVNGLYADKVVKSLETAGFTVNKFVFQNGELSKNVLTYTDILEALAREHFTRTDIIAALGGGVVGDVAGFAAATYLRGIDFVQLPTTLLAAVDSSVGGKTGINLNAGKNLAGAFHQPLRVICDIDFLSTLSDEIMSDGIAESIKCGMIRSRPLFDKLKFGSFTEEIEDCIAACIGIKAEVVSKDEHDTGERRLLNFGHTFGHAIEKASGMTITHGHAVSIGMVLASRAAERMGITEPCSAELIEVLEKYNLPTECEYDAETLVKYALSDKKREGGEITLILPEKVGKCIMYTVSVDKLIEIVRQEKP